MGVRQIKPLFIFSLPRSGSTLLQRMLMSHSKISSVAEPWLLLPLVYMYRSEGLLADYSQTACSQALDDLVTNTKGGMTVYHRAIREYAATVYEAIADEGSEYFLDKTPRYYKVISDVVTIFPDAKFIFLFRNPVHVYASIINTWNDGTFKRLWGNWCDLYEGPILLSKGIEKVNNRALAIRYEDLVREPQVYLENICQYLDIDYEEGMLKSFQTQNTNGRMGDSTGISNYTAVSTASLDKWKEVFGDRFRKNVLLRYVKALPIKALSEQGYDKQLILNEIEDLPVSRKVKFRDIFYFFRAKLVLLTKANLFFNKNQRWTRGKYLS